MRFLSRALLVVLLLGLFASASGGASAGGPGGVGMSGIIRVTEARRTYLPVVLR